jgi:hypothetical protein
MATDMIVISNTSRQGIPILINAIDSADANENSDIVASLASQLTIPVGAQLNIERQRVDVGQLDQLRRKKLISYS